MSEQKIPRPILVMSAEQVAECKYAHKTLVNYRSLAKKYNDIDTVLKITHALMLREMEDKNE